jgi:N-acetylmuramoyl-L-alanine amidase
MIPREHTTRIIFHHSLADVSSVEMIRDWHFVRGMVDIGYHYVIRKTGTIEHGRDVRVMGAHCLGRNHDSVGVCFEGDFRKYGPTQEQVTAALRVYHSVCRLYSARLKIEFHRDNDNPCPGVKLDRADLIAKLQEAYDG